MGDRQTSIEGVGNKSLSDDEIDTILNLNLGSSEDLGKPFEFKPMKSNQNLEVVKSELAGHPDSSLQRETPSPQKTKTVYSMFWNTLPF